MRCVKCGAFVSIHDDRCKACTTKVVNKISTQMKKVLTGYLYEDNTPELLHRMKEQLMGAIPPPPLWDIRAEGDPLDHNKINVTMIPPLERISMKFIIDANGATIIDENDPAVGDTGTV